MLTRRTGYLTIRPEPTPPASETLQREGFVVLPRVFDAGEIEALAGDVDRVFGDWPPDERVAAYSREHWEPFRYEMLSRSSLCQQAIARREILDVVEPLLGEDCHVIANTAWRQPAGRSDHGGQFWHIDSGPHVPRPADIPWDERIPYPVFAVAAHLMLADCPLEAGPTGVIPGSHTSGQPPPSERLTDLELACEGRTVVPVVASAGDVALFVSDVWHRRLPQGPGDPGRFFLQCHYARRDIAQRLRPTSEANQVSDGAAARATTRRERTLIGLHDPGFYDG